MPITNNVQKYYMYRIIIFFYIIVIIITHIGIDVPSIFLYERIFMSIFLTVHKIYYNIIFFIANHDDVVFFSEYAQRNITYIYSYLDLSPFEVKKKLHHLTKLLN